MFDFVFFSILDQQSPVREVAATTNTIVVARVVDRQTD
jgi:hypothetical protein